MPLSSRETSQPVSSYTAFDFTTPSLYKAAIPPTRPRAGTPLPPPNISNTAMPPPAHFMATSYQCPHVSGILADLAAKDLMIAAKDKALHAYRTQTANWKHSLDAQQRANNAAKRATAMRAAYNTNPLPTEPLKPRNEGPPHPSSDASAYVLPHGITSPHYSNIGIPPASLRLHRSNRATDRGRQLREKLVFVSAYQEAYHRLPALIDRLKREVHEEEEELDIVRTMVQRERKELEMWRGEREEFLRWREEKRQVLRLLAEGKEGRESEGEARERVVMVEAEAEAEAEGKVKLRLVVGKKGRGDGEGEEMWRSSGGWVFKQST